MGKLFSKGKHTVKVGNHLHTDISKPAIVRRGDHKCRILEMHLKLKDQHFKTILFIYRMLYQIHMVTTNQKSTIDTHTKKKKESKHNTVRKNQGEIRSSQGCGGVTSERVGLIIRCQFSSKDVEHLPPGRQPSPDHSPGESL